MANVVGKASVPGKTKVIVDCVLAIECAVIEPCQLEMIDRINLMAEIFQGINQRLRHVLVEEDFHLAPVSQNGLILPTFREPPLR